VPRPGFAAQQFDVLRIEGVGGLCCLATVGVPSTKPFRRIPQVSGRSVRRHMMRIRYALIFVAVGLLASCDRAISPAQEQLDWATVSGRQMILVSTTDPDGEPRTTRLWIVVVGESGYLRSADTQWAKDVERNPNFLLIVGDASYPVSATRVPAGTDEHSRVMDAYSEKYGLLGRTVLRFYSLIGRYSGPSDARILRLEPEPPGV
jgi:hypothetical protein